MDYQQNPQNSAEDAYRAAAMGAPGEQRSGLATAVLVLGIVSLIGICCYVNLLTAPIAIILGIVALVKHRGATGLSVTGIVLSVLSLIVTCAMLVAMWPLVSHADEIFEDYKRVVIEQDEVFPAYEADKTLPDYLKKYQEPPYSDFLAKYDLDFYSIMDLLLENYKNGELPKPEDVQTAELVYADDSEVLIAVV